MMFPLCTRVTDFRPLSIAYRIAFRTRRFEPVSLTGLTPIPLSARTRTWNSVSRISISRRASGVPFSHSIPAYTSSVPSRKMTMSRRSGCVTGLGTPGIQETGRTLAYRSSAFRNATFKDRKPTLTGVVSGPFNPTTYSRIAPRVASGSMSPYWNMARSPAGTGYQAIRRRPPKAPSTAASIALRAARTTSGPMPSPSISGMIGSSGTRSPLSAIKILWPVSGDRRTRRSDGMHTASGPLVEGHVHEVFRAHVPVEWPQEAIVLPVLDDLGRPSGDPSDREDRGQEVRRNPEAAEDQTGVEVHVRIDVFRGELSDDGVLDRGRDPVIRVVTTDFREAAGVVLEDEGPRVVRLVDAMAEPEDLLFVPQSVQDELLRRLRSADPLDRVEGRLDRAAMEGPLERRDRGGDCAVEIGEGRRGDRRGERGRVHRMVRVENHGHVHHPRVVGIGPPARHHPKEIFRVAELWIGTHDTLALSDSLVRGHDRPELGDESTGFAHVRGARHVVAFRIEAVHERNGGSEGVHRRSVLRHRTEQPQDGRREGARPGEGGLCLLAAFSIRGMVLADQAHGLPPRRLCRQVSDVVPAIEEAPALAVDETDRRLLDVDVIEALVDSWAGEVRLQGGDHVRRLRNGCP